MSPSFPTDDLVDVTNVKSERVRNFDSSFAGGVTGSDGLHHFNSYRHSLLSNASSLGVPVHDDGILMVFGVRGPLKIIRRVVQSVVVFVGHLREAVRVWNEGETNRLVASDLLLGSVCPKDSELSVTILVDVGAKNSAALGHRLGLVHPNVGDRSREASHVSKITDFVKAFKSRNRSPFFGHITRLSLVQLVNQRGPKINSYFPGLRALEA